MNPFMDEIEKRNLLKEVALGNAAPDTVIANGTAFNVFTGEFIAKQAVWIKGGMIAYVGPDHDPPKDEKTSVIDAEGMVLLPGLIEGHTHLNRMGIEEFTRYAIPSGVTTVVMESIELGMIGGKRGIEHFARGLNGQPIRFFYTVSPTAGLIPSVGGKVPTCEESRSLLEDPKCMGLGEIYWADIFVKGAMGERMRDLASLTLRLGKRVEGHTAGASGRKLQAYACLGPSSCHEATTEDEVMERLRLGYWVMLREGAVRQELEGTSGVFKRAVDFRRMILVTDGVDPERFIKEGYLDAGVKKALKLGVPPHIAYQMVTINAAEHFRLDHVIGSLSPGKAADLILIPGAGDYSPQLVMCEGRVIFRDGKALAEPREADLPEELLDTVRIESDRFPPLPDKGRVRAIEYVTRLVTKEKIVDLDDPGEARSLVMLLAADRIGGRGSFMGLLKGLGLQRGAYGSTMTWDTVDMVVAGCDLQSMKTAIGRLKEIRGGGVYAIGNEIVAEISTPFCGSMSLKPMRKIYEEAARLESALTENGVSWEKPVLAIDTLTTPAIPHLRISHEGYVRLKDRQVLPLEV
jgi:adenine deaminase